MTRICNVVAALSFSLLSISSRAQENVVHDPMVSSFSGAAAALDTYARDAMGDRLTLTPETTALVTSSVGFTQKTSVLTKKDCDKAGLGQADPKILGVRGVVLGDPESWRAKLSNDISANHVTAGCTLDGVQNGPLAQATSSSIDSALQGVAKAVKAMCGVTYSADSFLNDVVQTRWLKSEATISSDAAALQGRLTEVQKVNLVQALASYNGNIFASARALSALEPDSKVSVVTTSTKPGQQTAEQYIVAQDAKGHTDVIMSRGITPANPKTFVAYDANGKALAGADSDSTLAIVNSTLKNSILGSSGETSLGPLAAECDHGVPCQVQFGRLSTVNGVQDVLVGTHYQDLPQVHEYAISPSANRPGTLKVGPTYKSKPSGIVVSFQAPIVDTVLGGTFEASGQINDPTGRRDGALIGYDAQVGSSGRLLVGAMYQTRESDSAATIIQPPEIPGAKKPSSVAFGLSFTAKSVRDLCFFHCNP
jgi:hypothetical protein